MTKKFGLGAYFFLEHCVHAYSHDPLMNVGNAFV